MGSQQSTPSPTLVTLNPPLSSLPTDFTKKGVTYRQIDGDHPIEIVRSLFQEIAYGRIKPSGDASKEILYTDDHCVIFAARKGVSSTHLLVVPKRVVGEGKRGAKEAKRAAYLLWEGVALQPTNTHTLTPYSSFRSLQHPG